MDAPAEAQAAPQPDRTSGRVARGADGAGLLVRLYRRSPVRALRKVTWDHRGVRPNDVLLAAYPRSGTSWFRFLLVEMLSGDASFERISREVPYVGRHRAAPRLLPTGGRVIKTHEPYLRQYRRAIHLVRDPRDVAVSYFTFMQRVRKLVIGPGDDVAGSFDRFVSAFLDGRVDAHGTWQTHLRSWTRAADEGRADVLRVRFEDVRADPVAGLTTIAEWLGLTISTDRAAEVAERCSLERMRAAETHALQHTPQVFKPVARTSGVPLIGRGSVGGWRDVLDEAQQRRFGVMADGLALMGYPPA